MLVGFLALTTFVTMSTLKMSLSTKTNSLVIGGFFPLTNNDGMRLGKSNFLASQMALQDIVKSSLLLPKYNLTMIDADTQCKASEGTKQFFDMMDSTHKKLILFGDSCTEVNEPIAMTAKYWDVIQLSYGETHPKFSAKDKDFKYKTFYNMLPTRGAVHKAKIHFLSFYNWTQIGTLVQSDEPRQELPHSRFVNNFRDEDSNKTVISQEFNSKEMKFDVALRTLKEKDAHVISGFFNKTTAHRIFCEAYHQQMYGSNYAWLLTGYHDDSWWKIHVNNVSCTQRELLTALDGHFMFEYIEHRWDNSVSKGLRKPKDFQQKLFIKCQEDKNCRKSSLVSYAYDGVWTIALAIDKVLKTYKKATNSSLPLNHLGSKHLSYSDWFKRLNAALNQTDFQGVTGQVKFHNNERLGHIRVAQFRNNSYVNVFLYNGTQDTLEFLSDIIWPGMLPPKDRTTRIVVTRYITFSIFCVMCVLTCLGLILSAMFLGVNIYFRNHRFIKMSSPNMNNLIVIGSMLTYVSVMLFGLDTQTVSKNSFSQLCTAKSWVLCWGFSLAFGSMFAKTWRVHSIFTNIKLNKKAIKDYQLLLLVGALLFVDTVILSVWVSVDSMERREKSLPAERNRAENLEIQPKIEYCYSQHSNIFQGIIFGIKGLLLVLGVFLAWETRHVNIPALNDSKFIGMSVYNVVIMCSIGVALSFILQDQIDESYALLSIFIIFCTTLTLCLVFVPKMIELSRNPKGIDKNYRRNMLKSALSKTDSDKVENPTGDDFKERSMRMEQDNSVWKRLLDEKRGELAKLIQLLKENGCQLNNFEGSDALLPDGSIRDESSSGAEGALMPDLYGGIFVGPMAPIKQSSNPTKLLTASPNVEDVTERTSLLNSNGEVRQNSLRKNPLLRFKAHNSVECEDVVRPTTIYYSFPENFDDKNAYHLNNMAQHESVKLISCMENSSAEDEDNLSSSKTLPSIQESYTNSSRRQKFHQKVTKSPSQPVSFAESSLSSRSGSVYGSVKSSLTTSRSYVTTGSPAIYLAPIISHSESNLDLYDYDSFNDENKNESETSEDEYTVVITISEPMPPHPENPQICIQPAESSSVVEIRPPQTSKQSDKDSTNSSEGKSVDHHTGAEGHKRHLFGLLSHDSHESHDDMKGFLAVAAHSLFPLQMIAGKVPIPLDLPRIPSVPHLAHSESYQQLPAAQCPFIQGTEDFKRFQQFSDETAKPKSSG